MRQITWLAAALVGCTSETAIVTRHPTISVLPESLDFGEVVADQDSGRLELFVQNVGLAELDADLTSPGAPFAVEGETHLVLPIDASATVVVTFTPEDLGEFDGSLVFGSNDLDTPELEVPLHGVGRIPYAPEIEVTPADLDFGTLDQGSTATRAFKIENLGDAPLLLGSVTQEGAGVFSLDADPSGLSIPPGEVRGVVVSYFALQPSGDGGVIHLPSNDADEPVVDVTLTANGGGSFDYPIALFDCPGVVDLIGGSLSLSLDGSASYDPLGAVPLTYRWDIVQRPLAADGNREIEPPDQAIGALVIDAAGVWEIALQVTNALGTPSVPAKCTIEALPVDELHVELAWSGATSDLDLHLAEGDAPLYDVPGDVSWCNATPDWGVVGEPADDGHLDLDDDDGFGPEQVGVNVPADGTYPVRVHLYDDGEDLAVTATVSVFARGVLVWSGSKVMLRNQVWEVGQVNWPDGSFGVASDPLWDAGGTRECDIE